MYRITMQDAKGDTRILVYKPHESEMAWEDGEMISLEPFRDFAGLTDRDPYWRRVHRVNGSIEPGRKRRALSNIKIQLGLSCNYSCSYCLQRFQPWHDEGGLDDIYKFFDNIGNWYDGGTDSLGDGTKFEFWGGEPFVYWRKLRVLGPLLKDRYPHAKFNIITNGSVLSDEIIEWIVYMGAGICISHDGPGQHVRGPDPLQDPEKKDMILKLYDRLQPQGNITFLSVLTSQHYDLDALYAWFEKNLDGRVPNVSIEGVVLPYTRDVFEQSFDEDNTQKMIWDICTSLVNGKGMYFFSIQEKIRDFIQSLAYGRPSYALGQKCGMDRPDRIAVTLKGEALTCHNVSPTAVAPLGGKHKIGTVDKLDEVSLTTATHWAFRDECKTCPVLQMCKGSCMFLQGDNFRQACDNEFAYNMGILCGALYILTGMVPVNFEGVIRKGH